MPAGKLAKILGVNESAVRYAMRVRGIKPFEQPTMVRVTMYIDAETVAAFKALAQMNIPGSKMKTRVGYQALMRTALGDAAQDLNVPHMKRWRRSNDERRKNVATTEQHQVTEP